MAQDLWQLPAFSGLFLWNMAEMGPGRFATGEEGWCVNGGPCCGCSFSTEFTTLEIFGTPQEEN